MVRATSLVAKAWSALSWAKQFNEPRCAGTNEQLSLRVVPLPPRIVHLFTPGDATLLHDVIHHSSNMTRTCLGSASYVMPDRVQAKRLPRNSISRNSPLFGPNTLLLSV